MTWPTHSLVQPNTEIHVEGRKELARNPKRKIMARLNKMESFRPQTVGK